MSAPTTAVPAKPKPAPPPRPLVMIGYVNIDPKAPERLAATLRKERPGRIGIERSTDKESEAEIERIVRDAVSVLLEKMVDSYSEASQAPARELAKKVTIAVGFDQREVERFASEAGGGVEIVRIESVIERYNYARDLQRKAQSIRGVREPHLKRPEFSAGSFQTSVDSLYYNERAVAMALSSEGLVGKRQEVMAQKLLDTKCDCAVVGFAHLVDLRGTLYNRLKHLKPRRVALNSASM